MHDVSRQLTAAELSELFEGAGVAERLARLDDPLGEARAFLASLPEAEQVAVLGAHPRIGETAGLSAASAREQGADEDPEVLAALAELNRAYEERFGFRFVVFVDRRPRGEIVGVLRERLGRSREQELETGLDELVAIARDRAARQ